MAKRITDQSCHIFTFSVISYKNDAVWNLLVLYNKKQKKLLMTLSMRLSEVFQQIVRKS